MDILIILTLILSALSLIGVSALILKTKSTSGEGIDKAELAKTVREAMSEMNTVTTNAIIASNSAFTATIKAQIEQIEKESAAIKEASTSGHVELLKTLNDSLAKLLEANTKGLEAIRTQNAEKLESIQKAVDEKLDATLTARLKASFDNVINQIGAVNTAVGEIKGLAKDVSSLNRVLTNVKTKGIVGEIALAGIIEDTLSPSQYETNKVTKSGSKDPVEFAVKMPNGDGFVYLPIDAKFPLKPYQDMKDAARKNPFIG